jgi:hypothetical protein
LDVPKFASPGPGAWLNSYSRYDAAKDACKDAPPGTVAMELISRSDDYQPIAKYVYDCKYLDKIKHWTWNTDHTVNGKKYKGYYSTAGWSRCSNGGKDLTAVIRADQNRIGGNESYMAFSIAWEQARNT